MVTAGTQPLFDGLAADFVAEGVDTVFGLMGDGNMKWMCAMGDAPEVQIVHARHENAAVAMADGWARSSGQVGVASVTCGPGLTQIGTALTVAARHGTPLVVFAGDTPIGATYHLQRFDAAPFVVATGALCLQVNTIAEAQSAVGRAFYLARTRRLPVVLSIPYDLQDAIREKAGPGRHSSSLVPDVSAPVPARDSVAVVAERLRWARRPVIIAGRGAVLSGCRDDLLRLAERLDAPVGTTVRAKGWVERSPRNLDIIGGYSSAATRDAVAAADLLLVIGASLSPETTDNGRLCADAVVIQIDLDPSGMTSDGRPAADLYLRADAGAAVRALLAKLGGDGDGPIPQTHDTCEVAPAAEPPQIMIDTNTAGAAEVLLDPGDTVTALSDLLPGRWPVAVGAGHFWNWLTIGLHGREPEQYEFFYDFGAISQGMAGAIGMSYACGRAPVVAIEGDGSLMMNIQELDTVARHRVPVLVLTLDDGGFGAEYHKLLAAGLDPEPSLHGWPDFAAIAQAFGLRGHRPRSGRELAEVIREFEADPAGTVVDIRVDPRIPSPLYRRMFYADA